MILLKGDRSDWLMKQMWENVFFTHWPLPADVLQKYIPPALELDTFEGQAWIGMVHFTLGRLTFKGLPFSVVPPFPEVNVRTYVTCQGQPGIFFISLDAKHWSTYTVARRWYNLAYYRANVTVSRTGPTFAWHSIRNDRRSKPAIFTGAFTPLGNEFYAHKGGLDHWLIERYCLYSVDSNNNVYCGHIYHPPWPLQKAKAVIARNSLAPMSSNRPNKSHEMRVHYSRGMETMFWNIQKLYEV